MSFTEAQKVRIRFTLGYPDVFRQNNPRLESAIEVIGGRSDTQALVEEVLAKLVLVNASIADSLGTAGLKRAEDIEWYGNASGSTAITQKKTEGRSYCAQLSIIFGVPLAGDIFGTAGYAGDGWAGRQSQYGGIIPLG